MRASFGASRSRGSVPRMILLARPFVNANLRALAAPQEAGLLARFITTLGWSKDSRLASFAPDRLRGTLARRSCDLPTAKIEAHPLFVYPSLAETGETIGMAPLEGRKNGCAVLVSDLGCVHDLIEEGETGFFFEHRNGTVGAALRLKLSRLLPDFAQLEWIAAAGYALAGGFSLPSVAADRSSSSLRYWRANPIPMRRFLSLHG